MKLDVERLDNLLGGDRSANFVHSLPGDEDTWRNCTLGPARHWSQTLQEVVHMITSFAYPAAVFWGEDLLLLHNETWAEAGGLGEQAQKQRGRLTADTSSALEVPSQGGKPRAIEGYELLREDATSKEAYTVLVSPLFDEHMRDSVVGLLAQLMPRYDRAKHSSEIQPQTRGSSELDAHDHHKLDIGELGNAEDCSFFDQHPFFHRFAEMLPSGLAILDHKAEAVFVNQHFFELTTGTREDKSFSSWPQSIHEDDYDRVMDAYQEAFSSQKQLRTEFRAQGEIRPWRLLLLTPIDDENIEHLSVRDYGGFVCSIVDISCEKSAELSQRQAAQEAMERREQQERFIDMTSHELRNPLSAILHCVEDIEEAVQCDRSEVDVDAIRGASEIINLCIGHQRNIVDDVLNYSKLDASMLALVPKLCEPKLQLAKTLRMFEPEFRKREIEFSYVIDDSYIEEAVSWVVADLARIGQVLVNLVTNGIKFTAHSQGEKQLGVSVAASHERPTSYPPNIVFFSSDERALRLDGTNTLEWGNGESIYIMVAVKDTGIGISEEGQARLFERFNQATPKTEEIYGGFGLGLNISRKLCHLHGGEVGVTSKEGYGSTFGFFFKVKRAAQEPDSSDQRRADNSKTDDLKDHMEALGNASPDESDPIPQFMETPLGKDVEAAHLRQTRDHDSRYWQSFDVPSHVQESENDQGADAEHPRGSQVHTRSDESPVPSYPKHAKSNKETEPPTVSWAGQDRGMYVLLVEDNIINQRIVYRKLEAKGYKVTTANNGEEAVDALRNTAKPSAKEKKRAFDVVLMDQEMPVMDGNAAARAIRELEGKGKVKRTPILGVTANVRKVQQDEMIESGMDDVISKPYKIDELVRKIECLHRVT